MASKFQKVMDERSSLLNKELQMMLGGDLTMNANEQKANETIMKLKLAELDHAFEHREQFHLSKHYLDYKDEIQKSDLYKIIKKMPKGGVLHAHDVSQMNPDYMLKLTYWDNLYVCFEGDEMHLKFSSGVPKEQYKNKWQLMKDARAAAGNVEEFDTKVRNHFYIFESDNPKGMNSDAVWGSLGDHFWTAMPFLSYKPVLEQYLYDTLKMFRDDNIMYVEIRGMCNPLYDLEREYDAVASAEIYKKVFDKFLSDYPDFFGAKLIYSPHGRFETKEAVEEHVKIAKEMKRRFPDIFAGLDIMGREDVSKPIFDYLPVLAEAKDDLDFFLHAGETNWYGTHVDECLLDAIALGTKRIGHGYALAKHPVLLEEVKKRGIGVEVNPISNQIMGFVKDIRNHPLATYIARGVPVALSGDNPGSWEGQPSSFDFYITFVAVASRKSDLRLLKKLAINSLQYSAYKNKETILQDFEQRWQKFIEELINA